MDIKRTGKSKLKKRIRTGVMIVVGLAAVGGITYGLAKLKPAAPTLDRSTAVIDTVKRGQMLREVHGKLLAGCRLPLTAASKRFWSRPESRFRPAL
jgi:hypothetical protein